MSNMENSRNKSTRVQIIEHNKIIRQEEGWDQDRRWKTNILKTNTWKYIPTVCGKQWALKRISQWYKTSTMQML